MSHPGPARSTSARSRNTLLAALAVLAGACTASPPAAPTPSADAWAVVDGREIRGEDVEKAYRRVAPVEDGAPEEEVLAAKLNLLNELIVQDLLIAKARRLNLEVTDAELDAAYADARKNISDENFQQELARRSLAAADMRDAMRREMLAQKVIEREVLSKATVSDQDIAAFYNANRAQFNLAEDAYHIAQIVVTPAREAEVANSRADDATTADAAERKVQMVMEKLKGGARFSELAREYSEDPESAPRGGDLGFVPVSALKQAPPPLRDAVLGASPGTVKLVNVSGVYTIALVVAREAAGQRDLTMPAVREGITANLRERKAQLLRSAYLSVLRSEASVDNRFARRLLESQGGMPSLAPTPPGTP